MTDARTLTASSAASAGDHFVTGRQDGHSGPQRLLPVGGTVPVDLRAHVARYGAPRHLGGPARIIAEVQASGLTGRGGAAFPAYRKLAAAIWSPSRTRCGEIHSSEASLLLAGSPSAPLPATIGAGLLSAAAASLR